MIGKIDQLGGILVFDLDQKACLMAARSGFRYKSSLRIKIQAVRYCWDFSKKHDAYGPKSRIAANHPHSAGTNRAQRSSNSDAGLGLGVLEA